jgi:hypothetical protein
MKRLALLALLATSGCVASDNSVLAILFNERELRANMCMLTPQSDSAHLSEGILDVAVVEAGGNGYFMHPVVRNQMQEIAALAGKQDITIAGVEVELIPDATLAAAIAPGFRGPIPLTVGGSTVSPEGLGVFTFEAISRGQALLMAAAVPAQPVNYPVVLVRYRVRGTKTGDTIFSDKRDFPVRLCRNCLGGAPGVCPTGGFTDMDLMKAGCRPQQDDPNLCCLNNAGELYCKTF